MTKTQLERLAVIETELKSFKEEQRRDNEQQKADIKDIKDMLQAHVDWESTKYDNLSEVFASKRVEWIVYGMVGLILTSFVVAIIKLIMVSI